MEVHRISRVRSGGQAGAETSWETPERYGNWARLQVTPNTESQHGFAPSKQVLPPLLSVQFRCGLFFATTTNVNLADCLPDSLCFLMGALFLFLHSCMRSICFECFRRGRGTCKCCALGKNQRLFSVVCCVFFKYRDFFDCKQAWKEWGTNNTWRNLEKENKRDAGLSDVLETVKHN